MSPRDSAIFSAVVTAIVVSILWWVSLDYVMAEKFVEFEARAEQAERRERAAKGDLDRYLEHSTEQNLRIMELEERIQELTR